MPQAETKTVYNTVKRKKLLKIIVNNPELTLSEAKKKAGYSMRTMKVYEQPFKSLIETELSKISKDDFKNGFLSIGSRALDSKDFSSAHRGLENSCKLAGYFDNTPKIETVNIIGELQNTLNNIYGVPIKNVPQSTQLNDNSKVDT